LRSWKFKSIASPVACCRMTDFYDLWKGQRSVVDELRERLNDAAAAAPVERGSAIRIQRLFRGAFVRATVSVNRAACVRITRVFRGHCTRQYCQALAQRVATSEEQALFYYHAEVVQKAYRGYYSRKHYHDYSARKNYIDSIRLKGDKLREQLALHYQTQVEEAEAAAVTKAQNEFEEVTQNLHHLISTKVSKGVFNSPYNPEGPVAVGGVPVEIHIKMGVRDLLRQRGVAKKGLVVDANGSRKIPIKPPKSKLSVQATSRYDVVEEQQKMDSKLDRQRFTGTSEFKAGHKAKELPYRRGLNEGSQYFDPWRNPYLMRGVPASSAELGHGRTTLDKAPMVHFHTAVGGNLSAVLPTTFDVILDAEESGGVARRHLSSTARFGVPDTCDVREEANQNTFAGDDGGGRQRNGGYGGGGGGSGDDGGGGYNDYVDTSGGGTAGFVEDLFSPLPRQEGGGGSAGKQGRGGGGPGSGGSKGSSRFPPVKGGQRSPPGGGGASRGGSTGAATPISDYADFR